MKLLGAHMSIAGGLHLAVERAAAAKCDALQIFTRSSNQWKVKPLEEPEAAIFREKQLELGVAPAFAHDSYLINLASPDPALHARSAAAFGEEIDRCDLLGLPYLIAHPGAHMGAGEEAGIDRIARALSGLFAARPASRVRVLLETTAGMGSAVGSRFEHLRAILDRVEPPQRLGVCLDTCHVFAAGYDISTERGYHAVMEEFNRLIGVQWIRAFHLNDSKKGLGCRLDRHEHIGQGALGVTAFWCLLNDPRFDGAPMVLETPKGDDLAEDVANLTLLRAQIGSPKPVEPATRIAVAAQTKAPPKKAAVKKKPRR
ncbi:MAG: deoxyribonuclease IV [Acidobacteria bacterium]|nr:deoxyribonuclease IV [Acidobacteriota bacterium]